MRRVHGAGSQVGAPSVMTSVWPSDVPAVFLKDEDGNTFSALSTEVYFGKELITVQQSQPYENPAPAGKTRKGGRKAFIDESPTLF